MKKILVVDDEDIIRSMVASTVGFGEYQVISAPDGIEALRLVWKEKPDLVLLDIQMPGLDGLEVCRRIKDDPDISGCRVIMLTGEDSDEDRDRGYEAGADAYFTKPFSPLRLLEEIERHLG